MKSLSRILTVCMCCVPAFGALANVATTAGSNLTAYNPSNAYNNQWATVSNARYDGNATAKVDFGNCNAVVLRCAQPKCNNGGCVDASVAAAIVDGCVKSNAKCKQYGDDLVNYMTAQLVASSNAKINQQQMALEQARLQAEAQAAAANAQNEQISQMQNQMAQMQQQMYQQQQESAQALQEALAQQAAQSAAAIENMKTAATEAAKQTEAGISAYQQDAINRGISEEVLARQQITGQIQTEIEDADTSVVAMKKAMQNAFDYAGCDARGNNCSAPRRIKKWRELAIGFLTPYDNAIDKIYDALVTAQTVGVDLSDIYMMLNNSCNSWGQYMCEKGADIDYSGSTPMSCPKDAQEKEINCVKTCPSKTLSIPVAGIGTITNTTYDESCKEDCKRRMGCKPCTLLKVLSDKAEVYEGWINPTANETDNGTVIACASNALDNTKLFARRTKNKNGAGLVDIDLLDRWLNQVEPNKVKNNNVPEPQDYCGVDANGNEETALSSAVLSRVVNTESTKYNQLSFCVDINGSSFKSVSSTEECPYINPVFAICDTHPFNIDVSAEDWREGEKNETNGDKVTTYNDKQSDMNRIIGLKVTVVSQQMYKQYEYLNATLRRLKTQLQKAVLTSNLEAAGAKSETGSSSGGLVGGKSDTDKEIVLAGAENCWNSSSPKNAYSCIQTNLNLIKSNASTNKQKAAKQLHNTVVVAKQWDVEAAKNSDNKTTKCSAYEDKSYSSNAKDITDCANALSIAVARKIAEEDKDSNRYSGWGN
ncbi:MAG: hypothetical protein II843_02140 [Alphaproteobacteria bacterium]|nr:hypothetical protein [Alphaproteobacteria bacterium]